MNIKKISFIIPAHNVESTIVRCIESIISINNIEKEIIVVCNNCIDDTENKISILKTERPEYSINLIINNNISNASMARNYGITMSSAEFIMFIDADDYINYENFNKIDINEELSDFSLITNNYFMIRDEINHFKNHALVSTKHMNQEEIANYLVNYCNVPYKYTLFVHCWAKIYKKSIIMDFNIRFNELLNQLEDVNFNMQYLNHCDKIYHTGLPIYNYDTDSNKEGMSIKSGNEEKAVIKIYFAVLPIKKILIKYIGKKNINILFSQLITSIARIWMIRIAKNELINIDQVKYRIEEILQTRMYKVVQHNYVCKENDSKILDFISKNLNPKLVTAFLLSKYNRR